MLLLRTSPRMRRRLGLALTVYGLLGIALLVPLLLLLAGPTTTAGSLGARDQLVSAIDDARGSLRDATTAARDSRTGLEAAATTAGSTGKFMTQLAGTLRSLAGTLRIEIPLIGTAPLAGAAGSFDDLANRADGLAADLETVRSSVSTSADDLGRLADDLDRLEIQLGRVGGSVDAAAGDGLGQLRIAAIALLAWLALPAAFSLWLGLGWLRAPDTTARRARPGGTDGPGPTG